MRRVYYGRTMPSVSDFEAENLARQLLRSETETIHTSNELVVHYVCVLIKERQVPHETIEFVYEKNLDSKTQEIIKPDKNGRFNDWPEGFCSFFDDYLSRLL